MDCSLVCDAFRWPFDGDLSMKEGSLFCGYEIYRTGMFQIVFLVSLETSRWGQVHGLGSMMFGLTVQKFLNIEWFLHWKLNLIVTKCFGGIGMCIWCCWKDLDEQDLMEFILVRFGFRLWEILIWKWSPLLKIQIVSQKTRFWKEKSIKDVVTFGPMAQATLVMKWISLLFTRFWPWYPIYHSCMCLWREIKPTVGSSNQHHMVLELHFYPATNFNCISLYSIGVAMQDSVASFDPILCNQRWILETPLFWFATSFQWFG